MAFSFLHTSDWHIAKPFTRFDAGKAGQLRAARLDAIDRLAAIARDEGIRHVLVAGDIYDHPQLPNKALLTALERLKDATALEWHLIPGNHDPGEAGGIWERMMRFGLPGNVIVHLEPRPVVLADDVLLLPAPILSKRLGRDPTAWMGDVQAGPGRIRIGLAHGPVATFGSGGYVQASIDPARAESAGLDYLALGDWHGCKQVSSRCWYSGTPEPEQFPDNEPGHALVVRVAGAGAAPVVERRETARFRWVKRTLTLQALGKLEDFVREIEAEGARGRDMLVELSLDGEIPLSEDGGVEACLDRLDVLLFHLESRMERLRLADTAGEIAALGDAGLQQVADRLGALVTTGSERERLAAERALRRLFAFARQSERGVP